MFVQQSTRPYLAENHLKARQLRMLGAPIRRIASHLEVSQSTVSVWVRDIEILPRHKEANRKRAGAVRGAAWAERHRTVRRAFQEGGRRRARRCEPLHFAGCMLYWAEGAKERNTVTFCNSDAGMVAFFVQFLRECFDLTADDLRFKINVYLGQDRTLSDVEGYWCEQLGLTPAQARKHTVNHFPTSSSGRKIDKLPYGVCTLLVNRSTWLVQHILGAIQEYSGFDQPTWLDGPPRKPTAR
jgi:hypothetical protein